MAAGPSAGLASIKKAIQQASTCTLDEQLDTERDLQRVAGRTDQYKEGVTAFLEKRAPHFHGEPSSTDKE